VAAGKHEFALHPSLMDAALQATAALMEDQEDPVLPFALDSLEIFRTTPDSAIVLVRQASEKPWKYQKQDIDVCDTNGAVCVRLRGFSARPLQGTMQELNTPVLLSDVRPDIRAEGESEQVQEGCEIVDVPEESPTEGPPQANVLTARTIHYLKKLLAKELKLDARLVETNAPLEKYGINSIMVMQLTNELEKSFGSLSKTLFFEYQNLEALAVYFVEEHREQLIRLFGMVSRSSKE